MSMSMSMSMSNESELEEAAGMPMVYKQDSIKDGLNHDQSKRHLSSHTLSQLYRVLDSQSSSLLIPSGWATFS